MRAAELTRVTARTSTRWHCPCGARLILSSAWIRNATPGLVKAVLDSWATGHQHLPGYKPSPLIRCTRRTG